MNGDENILAERTADDPRSAVGTAPEKRHCALLWDESFLWGIMAWRALQDAGLPFELLRAEEVRRGELVRYRMLFVPGGWASNKRVALGERGCGKIRRFVEDGGSYLGICGGAGLATREEVALLPVRRKSSSQRVASFSGGIRVTTAEHPIWRGVRTPVFTAWWPSQLAVDDPGVRTLAAYEEAQPEAFSSDISMENGESQGWPALETRYGILLNPERLRGEPAVLEGRCGRGKVVLSMLHFDTPGDRNGKAVLRNLWRHLTAADSPAPPAADNPAPSGEPRPDLPPDIQAMLAEIRASVEDLVAAGQSFMLWDWRNSFLLRWRRGVRGLEYSTLFVMVREIQTLLTGDSRDFGDFDAVRLRGDLREIRQRLFPFVDRAKRLLDREGRYLQTGSLTPLHCDDREIQSLRRDLFGSAMSHGGAFKCLIDAVDRLWFGLVRV
ncbi:MAG: BPL-N domain-containing protein [Syntrophales bacterium]|nr:BPL-N domain-containing protein [Syntrophales bacterium]